MALSAILKVTIRHIKEKKKQDKALVHCLGHSNRYFLFTMANLCHKSTIVGNKMDKRLGKFMPPVGPDCLAGQGNRLEACQEVF